MAVALSLLIVLPGLAQSQGYDDTRGTLSSGSSLTVDVIHATRTDDTAADAPAGIDESIADSYFNGTLYVSNDEDAHNVVRITAIGTGTSTRPGATAAVADNFVCGMKATVRNNRSSRSYTVYLDHDADNDGTINDDNVQTAMFEVVDGGTESATGTCASETIGDVADPADPANDIQPGSDDIDAVMGLVPARHGDTLTITVAGVSGSVTLTVDADGPEFSEISPDDGASLSANSVKFRFVVTDGDSGLAHDGELDYSEGDRDARAYNSDNDNFTTGEPRSMGNGAAQDIHVLLGGNENLTASDDQSREGTSGWRQRGGRAGVSYFLDMTVTDRTGGVHYWQLSATDRAGNNAMTDGDADDSGDQPFTLVVDTAAPEFKDARTGISFDEDKRREVVDRSSIALTFNDRDSNYDAVMNVDIEKFLIEGNTIVGYVQPGAKSSCKDEKDDYPKDIDGTCLGAQEVPPARIYLQLAEELAPDARPQVSMFGGAVLDLAGNPSSQDEIIPVDLIAPRLTVTMTTEVTDRPIIKRGGEITLSITSDEELRRLPTVYFAPVLDDGSDEDEVSAKLGIPRPADRVNLAAGDAGGWTRTYDNGDVGSTDGLYAVIVVGEDDNNNVGSTDGWDMDRTDKVPTVDKEADIDDLEGAGLLVEIDTNIDDPVFSLSPETDVDTKDTESANPFITIDFGSEKGEYEKEDVDGEEKTIKFFPADSHSAVEITSITLNGNDVSGQLSSVSNRKYTLGAQDLATGAYELKVTGRDDIGNTVSDSYKFDVVARRPYKVNLIPGWNLVSVPGTPLDSSIQAVMGDSMDATIVLAYQDDAWLTAVNDNGTWRGTLTDIVGGYGYWVQTTAFRAISALIPETDTSSVLPTAKVIAGWNLLGVVDVRQNSSGKAPAGGGEANDYFKNISWKVAYSFDTDNNTWNKSIPGDGANANEIINGKGYWVWSTEAGTLVP